jgi:hypothetical protein
MSNSTVKFRKKFERKNIDSHHSYYTCQYLLTIGDVVLKTGYEKEKDYKQKRRELKQIARVLAAEIFDMICSIIPDGYRTVLKFNGLHNDYVQLTTNLWQRSVIMHNHLWPVKLGHICEEDNYVIIECENKRVLKKFFKKYWFSIGKEQGMEVIILGDREFEKLLKWSRRVEGKRKELALIKMSLLTIDNQLNGFHFRVTSDKRDKNFFESILNDEIVIEGSLSSPETDIDFF